MGDGTLWLRTSGWEEDWHFCGKHDVAPDSPDFAFWMWLINDRKPMRVFSSGERHSWVEGDELEALREEYRISCAERD